MSGTSPSSRVLVIGLGNRYRQDDAVGLLVASTLRDIADANVDVIEYDGDPLDLLPVWSGRALTIVADALNLPTRAGQIFRFDPDSDSPPNREVVVSSHGHSLWDAWELANLLGQRPQRALILVVAGRHFGQGEELSPEVEKAIEGIVDRVGDEVGRFLPSRVVDQ